MSQRSAPRTLSIASCGLRAKRAPSPNSPSSGGATGVSPVQIRGGRARTPGSPPIRSQRAIILSAAMPATTQLELRLASRMSRLGTETAFEVLNRARQLEKKGKEIIHLEIGEPDFDTPANVIEAGVDALHKGWTHYGPAAGLPDLRQTVADYVSRTRGV